MEKVTDARRALPPHSTGLLIRDAAGDTAAPEDSGRNPGAVALALCAFLVFLVFSRATEFISIPKLTLVVSCLALFAATLGMELLRVAGSRLGVLMTAFTLSMAVSTPFAWWKGGAVQTFIAWIPNVILFFAGAQVATNLRAVRKLAYATALATVFMLAVVFVDGMTRADRLSLASRGTIGNANDLAASLLIGVPFCLAFGLRPGVLRKAAGFTAAGMALLMALRTGSRGGLVAMAVMALSLFFVLSPVKKLLFAVCAIAVMFAAFSALPQGAKARYATLFRGPGNNPETKEEARAMGEATASAEERTTMLRQSIKLTFQHPFLGVGPGQFIYANNEDVAAKNQRKPWLVSHNSYTQVSSELGLPGFAIYMAILVHCFRITFRVRKLAAGRRGMEEADKLALCLRLSLIAYCVTSMFLTVAYRFYLPTIAVLACGLETWAAGVSGNPAWEPLTAVRARTAITPEIE